MTKILAALVGALLLANGVGLATIDDDADVAHPTTSTTTPRSTTSTSTGPTTPTTVPDELATLVHQLQAFVEAHRGLRFKAPLKFSLLSDAAFRRHVLKMAQEDDAELIRTADELRALGLIKSSDDLKAGRDELLGSAIVGLYDPETKELQVRGTRLTPYVRSTLAHEITHALQDQNFDINHPDYDKREDEISIGFSAIAEGDAVRIQGEYIKSLSKTEQQEAGAEETKASSGTDLSKVPDVLIQLLVLPYVAGPNLVSALLRAGGQGRLDQAFRSPPTTTEEVLHPAKFVVGEGARALPDPPADAAVIDKGVVGEFVLRLMLAREMSIESAARAAAGWGGDRYVAWQKDGNTCVRASFAMDTAADRDELAAALKSWSSKQDNASSGQAGDTLTLTSCA